MYVKEKKRIINLNINIKKLAHGANLDGNDPFLDYQFKIED